MDGSCLWLHVQGRSIDEAMPNKTRKKKRVVLLSLHARGNALYGGVLHLRLTQGSVKVSVVRRTAFYTSSGPFLPSQSPLTDTSALAASHCLIWLCAFAPP